MDDYGMCWRPIEIVDWRSVAAGVETQYLWIGLVAGYLGAMLTILAISYITNWRHHG